jgi:integrase
LLGRLDAKAHIAGEAAFHGNSASGHRMSTNGVASALKRACARAGLEPEDWSAHGLRAGGATSAAEAGAKTAAIEAVGRWAPGSRQAGKYIRQRDEWHDHPLTKVMSQPSEQ